METANLAGPRRPPSDVRRAKPESDIDLERIIYDPVYRAKVRDQLNRAKAATARDKDR